MRERAEPRKVILFSLQSTLLLFPYNHSRCAFCISLKVGDMVISPATCYQNMGLYSVGTSLATFLRQRGCFFMCSVNSCIE